MKNTSAQIDVQGTLVRVIKINGADYICITDIAALKNSVEPKDVVKNWMRSRATISFLGLWEKLHNPEFKGVDFDPILRVAGDNAFTMSPTRWVETYNAKGIFCKLGRNGATFAHKDIAFEFTSWISPEFKLYLISEFERLKAEEQKQLGWNVRRELSKINYRIHTDAIKQNLIPTAVTRAQMSIIYANEADVLNVALFGKTAQQWERENPDLKGNQRDYASINAKLMALKPEEFEELVSRLFCTIGFREMSRTRLSGDGGIDVRGTMVTGGVIRTELAIQVKRWKHNVQAPTVQQVRGSLGAHEQGCIVTTSDFSSGAREEASKMDKAPIALIDGKELINLLMENQVGVRRKEVALFEVQENLLDDVGEER